MVPVLTTINLQHKLSLGVTPLASSDAPSVDSSTFNNLAPIFTTQGKYIHVIIELIMLVGFKHNNFQNIELQKNNTLKVFALIHQLLRRGLLLSHFFRLSERKSRKLKYYYGVMGPNIKIIDSKLFFLK